MPTEISDSLVGSGLLAVISGTLLFISCASFFGKDPDKPVGYVSFITSAGFAMASAYFYTHAT